MRPLVGALLCTMLHGYGIGCRRVGIVEIRGRELYPVGAAVTTCALTLSFLALFFVLGGPANKLGTLGPTIDELPDVACRDMQCLVCSAQAYM